jgi:hypothetical protein
MPILAIYTPPLIRGFVVWLSSIWRKTRVYEENNQEQKVLMTVIMFMLIGLMLSYSGLQRIRINDRYWNEVQTFSSEFVTDETLILSNVLDFRQHSYHLPDYHVYGWIIPELSGPYKIDGIPQIPVGWIFHAYQREDNYDLNPESHPLNTTLQIPSNVTGLIFTDYVLASSLRYSNPDQPVLLEPISDEYWNLNYVRLPEGVSEIVLINGELVIQ